MSKAVNSPTARLLQSSRLFSLPRSLPQPSLEGGMSSTGLFRASDSATSTYPTHQAITTPASSHYRGDWGLKRPLPGKATRGTSTPHIRMQAQDTPEHITDFASAADHTATVLKWQESGIPMVVKPDRHRSRISEKPKPVSVYEESADSTEGDAATRWKFTGPFIAGMGEGEFERYLNTAVQSQRDAWHALLRKKLAETRLRDLVLREEGTGRSFWKRADVQKKFLRQYVTRISHEHLDVFQKQLRDEHATDQLSSKLTELISAFLDLPAVLVEKESRISAQNAIFRNLGIGISETAPPSTHPGAGISHLRTNAIMSNHPLHGPQLYREPILARVLKPRNHATNNETNAKLGVAGVVAQDPVSGNFQTNSRLNSGPDDPEVMANAMNPDLAGGNKIWVHPQSAWVDERGRLRMEVIRGDREAIAVKTDNVQHIHEARRSASAGNTMSLGSIGGTQRQSQMTYGGQSGSAQQVNRSRTSPNRGHAQPDLVGALKGAARQRQPAPRYPGLRSNVSGFDVEGQSGRAMRDGEQQ